MWVPTLGQEDPLEEGMATHFSIHAWRIPMDRKAWRATVHRMAESWTRPKGPHVRRHKTFFLPVTVLPQ